jgi:PII-like signaling protein
MRKLDGEQYLMRIFIGEAQKVRGRILYRVILETLKNAGFAGATVLRGIAGFGPHSIYHSENILRLSRDLPVVIEAVDSLENIDAILPELELLVKEGMVTIEKARVIRYMHKHEGN